MADSRFFECHGPFSLGEIAARAGAELGNGASADIQIEDVAPLDVAHGAQLSFLDNIKYKDQFSDTSAGACIVHPDMAEFAPHGVALLFSDAPYKSYALAAQMFYPESLGKNEGSDKAFIHPEAVIHEGVHIDAFAVIKKGAVIGEGSWIESGAVIGENVHIGSHCRIGTNASVSHCLIGNHVRLYSGVCVGQDGFGFAIDPAGFVKVPQLGRVIIEDGVQIGSNTTIDRGAGPDTVIGAGSWIDNLVQIGHNVKIGRGCILVSQVGISGSSVIDDFVAIGGQAGVAGHLHIGKGARVAAQSGVMKDIPAGEEHMGSPSMPIKQFMRQVATLKRLIQRGKNG